MIKVKKDIKHRKELAKNNLGSLLTKVLFNNKILPLKFRTLHKSPNKFYSTHVRNYCQLTGRARGVLPTWKVSRIVFKTNADLGLIPGIRGASW